ncbi:MAG TPA: protein YgfX, partial [Methylophilaceae bacterium]|nr:protein YgfX [Methylophilaceae bacterium]
KVQVLPESFVAPYLTILNLRVLGRIRRRHLLLTPGGVDMEAFRQLRVWLRWGNQTSSGVAAEEA